MSHGPDFIPALIVFGKDESGKAHASVFDLKDFEAAQNAADAMGMDNMPLELNGHPDIVAQLPAGRLFESGKAFVPFVKAALYDRIAALAGPASEHEAVEAGDEPTNQPETAPTASHVAEAGGGNGDGGRVEPAAPADPWAAIKVGSIVLAADGPEEGFFEARVTKVKAKGIFTVRFRDYPDAPPIDRQTRQLGLLHPDPMKAW